MELLRNTLLEYAWGSRTVLAELLGAPSPSPRPQAEMWMGAHPAAPSVIASSAARTTLAERIAASPETELGEETSRRFRGRLPFLLKVIAVEQPLSLQAHPDADQAREGFEREERSGLARSDARRNYRDASHKPEILCALGPFEALCGFRSSSESIELLGSLAEPQLEPWIELLRAGPEEAGLRAVFEQLMSMDAARRPAFVEAVVAACRRAITGSRWQAELGWTIALAERYPGDAGAVAALLLRLFRFDAGEAIFLPAGSLHSYLKGAGIELMASSDNVLRGGLTPKHVDVVELLRVVNFGETSGALVKTRKTGQEQAYLTPTADFRLSAIELQAGRSVRPARRGPEILLCVRGNAHATLDGGGEIELKRGASVFVPASDPPYELRGQASIFRATVGDLR